MIICDPLGDEIALSHALRLQRINGLAHHGALFKLLRSRFSIAVRPSGGGYSPPDGTRTELLARLVGLDLRRYVVGHSFVPFNLGTSCNVSGALSASELDVSGCRTPRRDLIFCRACVQEDLDSRGFSFWRRRHQFLGALRCRLHQCPLWRVQRARHHVTSLPSECLDACVPVDQATQHHAAAIDEYQELCERMLASDLTLSASGAIDALFAASQRVGSGLAADDWWTLALERFGESWLLNLHSEAATTAGEQYLLPTFSLLTGTLPGFLQPDALAIAALTLTGDVDSAYQAIAGQLTAGQRLAAQFDPAAEPLISVGRE